METFFIPENLGLRTLWIFALSFLVSYLVLPRVIEVVRTKNLMDKPNERSSHVTKTPTMGGIAFYISVIFTLFFIKDYDSEQIGLNIISSISILFFIGIKDDLVGVKPITKIITQLLATIIIFFGTELKITTLDNFLFINEIPYWFSVLLSCMIVMVIVNSFNLIDGINGSAAMVGIVTFGAFAYVFYNAEAYYYLLFSVLCIGFLLAFLRYNLSSTKRIFMGDTGSMIVGFMIGILILKYLSLDSFSLYNAHIQVENKIWVLLSIVFIPLFDTSRVFAARMLRHGKPFKADRSHIHHVMIDYMGLTHAKASLLLAFINLIIFAMMLYFNTLWGTLGVFLSLAISFIVLALLLFYFNRSYITRKSKQKIRKILNNSGLSGKK